MKGKSLKWGKAQQRAKEGKIMDSTVNFPCIKFDPTAPNLSKEQREAYEKYQNLMQYGYPTDVPLSQAVKEFNDCFPNLASRQPIIKRLAKAAD
jgi:hypothetical protein